ncbi:TMV resistance protein [Salix suchowensis]|nr:TMV resistance protein [Salix suchowensis]
MDFSSYTYQVFLSFRGEDTRKKFTDHLYSTLTREGIITFRDDNSIQRGENIESEIERAIKESQMSVVVLSKDYASSSWCLDELAMIMDRKRTAGHIVLPVFYDVDPSQVGEQTGNYAEAFAKHRDNFPDDLERVEKWKATLKEVAYLGGMVLQDRYV